MAYTDEYERLDQANEYSLSLAVADDGALYCVTYQRERYRMVPDYQEVKGVTPYLDQLALCNEEYVFVIRY